jgi:hypothetical protein
MGSNILIGIAIGSGFAGIMTGFGDYIHYMNRDVKDWIYACEGFIGVLIGVGWIIQIIATKFV